MATEVTDPKILAQLNAPTEVTDPALLAQLNAPSAPAAPPVVYDAAEFQRRVGRAPEPAELADFQLTKGRNWAGDPNTGAMTLGQVAAQAIPGTAEAGLSVATGIPSSVAGGVKYLYGLATGEGHDAAAQSAHDFIQAHTYTPRTQFGQGLTDFAGAVGSVPGLMYQTAAYGGAKGLEALGAPVNPEATREFAGKEAEGAQLAAPVVAPLAGEVSAFAKGGGVVRSIPGAISRIAEGAAEPSSEPVAANQLTGAAATAQKVLDTTAANEGKSSGAMAASPQIAQASPELQAGLTREINKAGADTDLKAVDRQLEADSLPVPVHLTEGQATLDPNLISEEQNMRGKAPELAQHFNEQNGQLTENLQAMRDRFGPDVFTTDPVEHGRTLIKAYQDIDNTRLADIDSKYQALRDAAGGQFPVDTSSLLGNVRGALNKELLTDSAPPSVMKVLDNAASTGSMPYEQFEALRTNLATIQRTAQDGLVRRAAGTIRNQLEQLPISGDAAQLKPLADAARTAAKSRFQALEADPAYKAAVEGEAPDSFVNRYVIHGNVDDVAKMREALANNPQAQQTVSVAALDHLRDQAGVGPGGSGNFRQAGYNRALAGMQNGGKLKYLVGHGPAEMLERLGNVARHVQAQPAGSYVNHSNTLVGGLAKSAGAAVKGGLEHVPVAGPIIKGGSEALENHSFQKRVQRALSPTAGVRKK